MRRRILALVALVIANGAAVAQPLEGRLKTISETGTVKLAYRADSEPFSFVRQGQPAGYTVDLCELVVRGLERQLGGRLLTIEWVPVDTGSRFAAVASGRVDMECGSSTVTLARLKEVDFSSFVFVESTGLIAPAGGGYRTLNDFAGKKLAVIAGTTNERAIRDQLKARQLDAEVVVMRNREDGISALENGQVDAFASDKLLLTGARYRQSGAFVMLPEDLSFEPYAIVLPRGDWAFRLAVNTALADVFRSGRIMQVYDKWFMAFGLRPSLLLGAAFALGALPE
jgi:ABC-type amino acid transport substrate-binding protein